MTYLELLKEYGVPLKRHGESSKVSEGWAGCKCPFCEHEPYLGVNLRFGSVSCWKCGPHGQAETFAALTGVTFQKAMALVKGLDRPLPPPDVPQTGKLVLPYGLANLSESIVHVNYLKGRGFDPVRVARDWGVQAIRVHSRLAWRLFIPIHLNKKVVSWTTRRIVDGGTERYIGAKQLEEEAVPRKQVLYGEDHVRHTIVIHEGPTDVWATGPGAVATMGTGFTQAQVLRASRYPVRVVCFDSDAVAQMRAEKLTAALSSFPGKTLKVRLESGKDAACADKAEVAELRRRFLD